MTQGKIELSTIGRNKFHGKITCKNRAGGFSKLLEAIARRGLEIVEISSFVISGFSQIVFCIEVKLKFIALFVCDEIGVFGLMNFFCVFQAKSEEEIGIAELRKVLSVIVGVSEEK